MGTPPRSDEAISKVAEAFLKHGVKDVAARSIGMNPKTFRSHLKLAGERGLLGFDPVLPGFEVKETSVTTSANGDVRSRSVKQVRERGPEFEMPEGFELKRLSTYTDGDDRITGQWKIAERGKITIEETVERIKKAFAGYKPAAARAKPPTAVRADLCTLIPCNDWHIGLFGWGKEVGTNWDLKIAERVIGAAIEDVISRSPASARAIVLGGGDLLHADNSENKTAKSGNVLDVDGRYQKVVDMACRLMARTVDAALRRHRHVTVRILKGNHDEHACVAVAYFLLAWYRKDKRVTVDIDPSLFFWFRFGAVMLGATHGHLAKLKDMPAIMAHRRAKDWGESKHRFIHGFHIHHHEKLATEGNGCISEAHQAPIPQDSWHYGKGFLSGRSVQAITYHRRNGEFSRVRTAIMDA